MNEHSMIEQPAIARLEMQLERVAPSFLYPSTPDVAGRVKHQLATKPTYPGLLTRRLAWGAAIVALTMAILLSVPTFRATVLGVLRQSPLRAFLFEPFPTFTPLVTITPSVSVEAPVRLSSPQPIEATPHPSATPVSSILNLAREIPPTKAKIQVDIPVILPARPLNSELADNVLPSNPGWQSKEPIPSSLNRKLGHYDAAAHWRE